MAYIYVITNMVNKKQYVGKTNRTIKERFQEHCKDCRHGRVEKRPLYDAMNKYGVENFSVAELEECSSSEACERERHWIETLDTFRNGYNATAGGDGKNLYDYEQAAQAYKKMRNEKRVCALFGCDRHTVVSACREKGIKILTSGEVLKEKHRRAVVQCGKQNHNVVYNIFDSIGKAYDFLKDDKSIKSSYGTARTHILEVCHHKRKSAFGYYWKFL